MPAPSNITANPSQVEEGDLPQTVSISGIDMFERPYSTGNEQFSQSGTDVPVSEWKGTVNQGEGLIGDSFIGNKSNAYVDEITKLPSDYQSTKFIGCACRVWLNSITAKNGIFSIKERLNTANRVFEVVVNVAGGGNENYAYVLVANTQVKVVSTNFLPPTGEWFDVFAYVDFNSGSADIGIWINGVQGTTVRVNQNPTNWSGTIADDFRIGARSNNTLISSPIDGKICNVHWSTDVNFKNERLKYEHLPTIEVV